MCCLTFELSCAQRRAMPLGVSLSEGLGVSAALESTCDSALNSAHSKDVGIM